MADKITLVTNNRYAMAHLFSGRVPIKGFDVEIIPDRNRERDEGLHHLTYDLVEMPISNYLIARDLGVPMTAIAAFPSLAFPQEGTFINRHSGIQGVDDLIGKRVGVNGFGYNPAVWLMGMLSHQYDLPVEQITWVEDYDWATAPLSPCQLPYLRSRRFTIEQAKELPKRLEAGEIDAIILPAVGMPQSDNVGRLFPDFVGEIKKYVEATGLFPMNTVVTIKEESVRAHPGLAQAVADAHREAWRIYEKEAPDDSKHSQIPVSELRAMGLFPRPEGPQAYRNEVREMVHYCYEQGLIRRLVEPEELFVAE
jgi:4,5-dihydroxyphthalate decarboxylase